jgi:hypothetical protein
MSYPLNDGRLIAVLPADRGPCACHAHALPLSYTVKAVLTGLEPVISTLTEWRGLQLPYKTMTPVVAAAEDERPLRPTVAGPPVFAHRIYTSYGAAKLGSRDRTRTYTNPVNNRTLYQLSYPGMGRRHNSAPARSTAGGNRTRDGQFERLATHAIRVTAAWYPVPGSNRPSPR